MIKWRLYLIEAALLAAFMVSACFFTLLLEHPASPLHGRIESMFVRRGLIGLAMGATAIALIYSPLGKRSGALMNPAMTLGFLRLGKIRGGDAIGYMLAQFAGGAAGVAMMSAIVHDWIGHPSVSYVATVPGQSGELAAWLAEFLISFLLVMTVMTINKTPRLAPYTGCFAGLLVATFVTLEAPISGMSMNPARTFGSALLGDIWTGWWIYFTAPVIGMLAGVELHARVARQPHHLCGRFTHSRRVPSPFKCNCLDATKGNL